MTPKILEYIDGKIIITLEAYSIRELYDIIVKYTDEGALPYLMYAHLMTWPDSPHINLPENEKSELVINDVLYTIGSFDIDEPLLQKAVERLNKQWETRSKRYYDSLGIIMDKVINHAREVEVSSGGRDGNLNEFNKMLKEAANTFKSYREVEKVVDEELKAKMKGKTVLGEY